MKSVRARVFRKAFDLPERIEVAPAASMRRTWFIVFLLQQAVVSEAFNYTPYLGAAPIYGDRFNGFEAYMTINNVEVCF